MKINLGLEIRYLIRRERAGHAPVVVGVKPPPNGGQNHPQPPFWPFLTLGVVLCHLGVVLSPPLDVWVYLFIRVVLSTHGGGFMPPLGQLGGGYCPVGVVLSPLLGDFIPIGRGGGGYHLFRGRGVWPFAILA